MEETWTHITGFEEWFAINTNGVVKRIKSGRTSLAGKILKPSISKTGYHMADLYINGKHNSRLIHRLVAMMFIPNPHNYPQINHKNGIKSDNTVENLEWCTSAMNNRHAFAIGLNRGPRGEQQGRHKLTQNDVETIRNMYSTNNYSHRKLGAMFGVCHQNIGCIVNNQSWSN